MADRVLFISWGETVRGREERGLEVFNEAVGFYGRCQQEGRIEKFDVVLMPATGSPAGYMELQGTGEQLGKLREDREFQRILADANLIVEDLKLAEGYTGEGIAQQMELYQEAVGKVAQMA